MTTMPLRDHAAYRRETLRWCGQRAARARTLDVFDPYSGLRVGTVPLATVDDVRRAFDYAGLRCRATSARRSSSARPHASPRARKRRRR
ncbi:glyceraldehyde-3-phosphate dehydrogenase [Burkholderia pseudomallei]|nr:glyceraldehyde-3-phosphate dehydrogenase [Burkholderia pseudomallei]VCF36764.1 glyceraldehyde-3-phosphate dehydrogenase [Burkholderia pseudomallei]